MVWKIGRGKLGVFEPLIGSWVAHANSDRGPMTCRRTFSRVLGGKYIELRADWSFSDSTYQEFCVFGVGDENKVHFWSFTSDGKRSEGVLADVSDIHPQAVGFEAEMPAGLARQIYWPDPTEGIRWAVESNTKKGWRRFVEHHYEATSE